LVFVLLLEQYALLFGRVERQVELFFWLRLDDREISA
jgi:hypothetical protein